MGYRDHRALLRVEHVDHLFEHGHFGIDQVVGRITANGSLPTTARAQDSVPPPCFCLAQVLPRLRP